MYFKKLSVENSTVNIFQDIPEHCAEEFVEQLMVSPAVRIERIVSRGHTSPIGFWYDQDEHEWVIVLKGNAYLQIEGLNDLVNLGPGDTYYLSAHTRHRVESTDSQQPTIWLAVFWKG